MCLNHAYYGYKSGRVDLTFDSNEEISKCDLNIEKKVESHISDRCSHFFTWYHEKLSDIVPDDIALYLFFCVWISDEAVILVFNVTFLVCGYQMKHSLEF